MRDKKIFNAITDEAGTTSSNSTPTMVAGGAVTDMASSATKEIDQAFAFAICTPDHPFNIIENCYTKQGRFGTQIASANGRSISFVSEEATSVTAPPATIVGVELELVVPASSVIALDIFLSHIVCT